MNRLPFAAATLALLIAPVLANGSETFRAQGNEPSWSIRMSEGAIAFQPMDGEAVVVKPIPAPRQDGTTEIYEAKIGADSFALTIASKICTDTMSGMPFPKSVTVVLGTRTFSGCGGEPSALLQGQWNITELNGKPAIAGSLPKITFEADGKVNGNASCNRFFGDYTLSGEGLTAGGLGASMMMCEQTLMDQEMKVLEVLKGLSGFGIGEDGKLILRTNDGRTIIATPAA
ncbi:MAG: META domain-containing protein [Hyphomicrobiales bacterium]